MESGRIPRSVGGLAEIEYEPDNDVTIKSAVVKYIRKPRSDLSGMQMRTNG